MKKSETYFKELLKRDMKILFSNFVRLKSIIMSIKNKEIAAIREEYDKSVLTEELMAPSPITQFELWLAEARGQHVVEPTAMVLSTVSNNNQPSSRIVLLKDIRDNGFCFFTNYESKKAIDIQQNNKVSLLFFWPELQRQVRIEGWTQKIDARDSDEYFASRPKASRIGAIASPQSQVIANRDILEELVLQTTSEIGSHDHIPRPEFWGGYLVSPTLIEFWQGRANRLHDRLVYRKVDSNDGKQWQLERLAP